MSELFNFRLARSPQRLIPEPVELILTHPNTSNSSNSAPLTFGTSGSNLQGDPSAYALLLGLSEGQDLEDLEKSLNISTSTSLDPNQQIIIRMAELDQWLVSNKNRPSVQDLANRLQNDFSTLITTAKWKVVRDAIGNALIFSLVRDLGPGIKQRLMRFMLVLGLVELFFKDSKRLSTPDDIYRALRWRTVAFPAEVANIIKKMRQAKRPILARRPGFADLFVVNEEWCRYEAAEVAYIENVLPGEAKLRKLVNTNETETTVTTDKETSQMTERDSQTTDRFDLHSEGSLDLKQAVHVEGQVDTSGTYGPTHVNTHVGGSLDHSIDQANERATTQSKESINRAVTKVEEKMREIRTTRTLVRSTETNKHSIDNSGKDKPIVGIYRWVDKVQRVQVVRYPHRFLLEFEVPEPGAWIRWLHRDDANKDLLTEEPLPLTKNGKKDSLPLTPNDITKDTYQTYGARYATTGLKPPPQDPIVVSTLLKHELTGDERSIDDPSPRHLGFWFDNDNTVAPPPGYKAVNWKATILSSFDWRYENSFDGGLILVSVGAGAIQSATNDKKNNVMGSSMTGEVGPISSGNIPISVMSFWEQGFLINLEIACSPSEETATQWQHDTYDQIAAAYYLLKQQHEDEKARNGIKPFVNISGDSPERNKEIITEELKRQVVAMLTGTSPFLGHSAITQDARSGEPYTDLNASETAAAEIQFIEQAFEWENLTYVLYPYYWAGHNHWKDLAPIEGDDPDFARFLRAGSARVVVPARPGFEDEVNLYTELGVIWGGGPIPAPNEPDYLSIAAEIKAQQQRPTDGVLLDTWEVRLPTTLIWLENEVPLPENPNCTNTIPSS